MIKIKHKPFCLRFKEAINKTDWYVFNIWLSVSVHVKTTWIYMYRYFWTFIVSWNAAILLTFGYTGITYGSMLNACAAS